MMKMWSTCCLRGILILLLTASAAWAQGTAQLSGTVRDESGGVLPGVSVTVTQTNTGLVRTTVTDETGGYLLTNLPTGPYRLEVALQGFKTYVQTGIVLQVGGTPTVNAVLGVGTLEESVTVEAAAPLVDVRSAGISSVVNNETDPGAAAAGTPGHRPDRARRRRRADRHGEHPRHLPGGVYISVAGGLPFGVAYTLDGAAHNNPQTNAGLPLPFPDALQEFQVATSGLSAENGVKSGASVNAVTKSGDQPLPRRRLRVPARSSFQRAGAFCRVRPRRQADGRRPQAQPVRRHDGRPHRPRQAVLLRRLPGHHPASGSGEQHCVRADGPDARGRLHDDHVAGVQRREADQPGRPVRRQPHRSGPLQPGGDEPRRAAAHRPRIPVARSQYAAAQRPRTVMNRSRGSTSR